MKPLRVPLERLPEQPGERHGRLRSYFCDKDAEAVRVGDEWELRLGWPGGEDRHVDPGLEDGLRSWDRIPRDQMALARRRSGRVLRALYDTWTLNSWSEWFARSGIRPGEPLTILHVDDHRDLMSPRLFQRGDALVDPIAGGPFDLFEPESVLSALESGAVGMGSFLTPVLHRFPAADVRQLTQPPKVTGTSDFKIALVQQPDDLLEPGASRPAVELQPSSAGAGAGNYRITNDLGRWLENIGPGPILLHVDMDYFNNRYDGDGDWRERQAVLDPSVEEVLKEVDRLTGALRTAGVVPRIEDAVIAYSPGFFPAELWEAADRRLEEGLEELYG
ncbi:MAG TPA: hypothetical protein VF574_08105 [Allosphingosinicella sp.]